MLLPVKRGPKGGMAKGGGASRRMSSGKAPLAERYGLVFCWAVLILVFSLWKPGIFPTHTNAESILSTQSTLLVVTMALLLPMTTGDFDVTVANTMGLSSTVVAVMNGHDHHPLALAIVVGLISGVLVGVVNALFVVGFGLDSFIVTLGMSTVLYGLQLGVTDDQLISGVDTSLVSFISGTWFGVAHVFYYGLLLAMVLWYFLRFTAPGRRMLIVGMSRDVAKLTGLNVARLRVTSFLVSGLIAAAGGVVSVGILGGADPTASGTFLLPAFAAAFLGATVITPGRYNAWGMLLAVYFLGTGIDGLQLVGASTWVQQVFYGGVLIVAVSLGKLAGARRRGRGVRMSASG